MRRKLALGCLGFVLLAAGGVGGVLYLLTARVEGQFFDADGVPIHYTVEGQGEPVILIHGLAAQADVNWRRPGINRLLRKDFQVIAYDGRGHGLSGKPHEPEKYGKEMVRDVIRLMDHLGIEQAHVAGYSMGGFIALALMLEHPERVRSAALCASGWIHPADNNDILNPYRPPPPGFVYPPPHLDAPAEARADQPAAGEAESPAPAKPPKPEKYWFIQLIDPIRDYVGNSFIDRDAIRAMKKTFGEMKATEAQLRANTVPAIAFMGTDDGLKPYADAMAERLANLEYVVYDGANHITVAIQGDFRKRLRAFFLAHREE